MKRIFDIIFSSVLLILFFPIFLLVIIVIKISSEESIFFKQERVTFLGNRFLIIKFRTMKTDKNLNNKITTKDDERITEFGKFLRKFRIDEIPQLINIFMGDMSFVGTRPEIVDFVKLYTNEMLSTLLLPAGVTSLASIEFKNENDIISSDNYLEEYVSNILPKKMKYNLNYIKKIGFFEDLKIMFVTVLEIFLKK